jgi:HlyD family secretion protein
MSEHDKKPSLFRKEAQAHLASFEQIDPLIQVVTAKSWLILGTLCALLFAFVLWGFFGKIPTRVEGRGILLAEAGSIYNAVGPEGSGWISSIAVNLGDRVAKGAPVAHLSQPDLIKKLEAKQKYLAALNQEYEELKEKSEEDITDRKEDLAAQKEILQGMLAAEKENLKQTEELMHIFKDTHKKGLSTRQEASNAEHNYYATKKSVDHIREQLNQNEIDEEDFIANWEERLRELGLTIKREEHEVDVLQAQLNISEEVKSPVDGIITGIHVAIGDVVESGKPIVSIASMGSGLDAMLYFQPDQGKRIDVDMPALVSPTTVKKEEFGSIEGQVIMVSEFPSTQESIVAVLQNQKLAEKFLEEGAPIAVRVRLTSDASTFSGYAWSSSKGPEQIITPGTLVEGQVTVRKQSPISLLIPAMKKLIGR